MKTFEETFREQKPANLNSFIVYEATPLETFIYKRVVYYKWIPLTKRTRVRVRRYFKYRWQARLVSDMVKVLRNITVKPVTDVSSESVDLEWDINSIIREF